MMGFADDITRFRQTNEVKITRRVAWLMPLLLIILTITTLVTEVWLQYQQDVIGQYASAMNPAGHQRTYAQRILYMSNILVTSDLAGVRFNTSAELKNTIRDMRRERDGLLLETALVPELQHLYYDDPMQLKARVDGYLDVALALADASGAWTDNPKYDEIAAQSPRLMIDLNATTMTYERLLKNLLNQLSDMYKGRAVFIIGGLAVAALLILMPGMLALRRYTLMLYEHITLLRQKITLLEGRQAFSEAMLASVPMPLSVYDITTGQTVFMNDHYRQLLGYTDEDVTVFELYNVEGVIHPDDIERARFFMVKAAETGVVTLGEYRLRRKDGSYVMVESRAMALIQKGVVSTPPQLVALIRPLDVQDTPDAP